MLRKLGNVRKQDHVNKKIDSAEYKIWMLGTLRHRSEVSLPFALLSVTCVGWVYFAALCVCMCVRNTNECY